MFLFTGKTITDIGGNSLKGTETEEERLEIFFCLFARRWGEGEEERAVWIVATIFIPRLRDFHSPCYELNCVSCPLPHILMLKL